jgi:GTP cyclohydrolase IA
VNDADVPPLAVATAGRFLADLGIDCTGPLARTPLRFAKALAELTAGLREPFDPDECLARRFDPPSEAAHMIIVRSVEFTSVCEHHLLPFTGTATVAYVPKDGAKVVGLSKLARLVTGFASVPQMQERLGEQVIQAIMTCLDAQGAGCIIRSVHTCMTLRGAKSAAASMTTSHIAGRFYEPEMRAEFLALAAM